MKKQTLEERLLSAQEIEEKISELQRMTSCSREGQKAKLQRTSMRSAF